jgi:hypothetical protein
MKQKSGPGKAPAEQVHGFLGLDLIEPSGLPTGLFLDQACERP